MIELPTDAGGTPTFYSVDRRGFYASPPLTLWSSDPRQGAQPFLNSGDSWFTADEITTHVAELFPDGMSLHGWEWMTWRAPAAQAQDGTWYTHNERAIELLFEYVRRISYQDCPSRLQSFFAFDNLDQARGFSNGKPIYRLTASRYFRADQRWLNLSEQNGIASFQAHRYWQSAPTLNPQWEYLLVPPVSTEFVET